MMKTLKMGFLGLTLGALGAVALPAQEAEACVGLACLVCCSTCNPTYQTCLNSAGNNSSAIAQCVSRRSSCEASCNRTC
ncbi:hypothetical protein [Cystobacter fuscus]|uniref:hypothetical protein n=1 Tax=Cystobacter fuscus TaxID=43 RepID=UPI002B29E91D|nr:hypothetical protein F0U63_18655 [Cystobacter fuscus]